MTSAATVRPAHRVGCPVCGWVGYRRRPWARACPACGTDAAKLAPVWLAGAAPHRGRCCYLAHVWPAYQHASHYCGKPASSGLLKGRWPLGGGGFAELARAGSCPEVPSTSCGQPAAEGDDPAAGGRLPGQAGLVAGRIPPGMRPPRVPGRPPTPRHHPRVVGACVLGVVVAAAVVGGAVPAGAVVAGTPTGAVVGGAGPDAGVVDVAEARVVGGACRSAPATTTPTEVLAPGRGRPPNKLASGRPATASTPVTAATATPKASTAATATRCQRTGRGCAWPAPSWFAPAWSPIRPARVRRATWWADANEWAYTASAAATSTLTSAAPRRVPPTPKNDATTAPLTAASAVASSLATRSCSMPHLQVGGGDGGAAAWGPRQRPGPDPAARAPTLATTAGSRQLIRGHEGDRAAHRGCGLGGGCRSAGLVRRAGRRATRRPVGPQAGHNLEHGGPPRVQESRRRSTFPGSGAGITTGRQESRTSPPTCQAGRLSRDNATARRSTAPTNCRLLQHFTTDLPRRWSEHLAGGYDPATHKATAKAARLLAAALHAGCQVELIRVWYGAQARTLEQRPKQRREPGSLRAGAARSLRPLCPVCNPAGWHRRYPNLPDPPRRPAWHRFRLDPTVWDARAELDRAFPDLAYGPRELTDRGRR
jgi:hypothetical protein